MRAALFCLVWLLPLGGCYDLSLSAFPDESDGAASSRVAWARRAGGPYDDSVGALVGFGDGRYVIAGRFQQEARFEAGAQQELVLQAGDTVYWDYFLAGFGPDGYVEWARQVARAGAMSDLVFGGAVLEDGFALAGSFTGATEAVFGPGEENETILVSAGFADVFLALFGPNGKLVWARRAGGAKRDAATAVTAAGGGLLVAGWFQEEAHFDDVVLSQSQSCTAFNPPLTGLFVARYDAGGELEWARQAAGCAMAQAIDALPDGGFLLTGSFAGDAAFGPGEEGETILSSTGHGDADAFLARYDADGALIWATGAGGGLADAGTSVAVREDGSGVVVGYFNGTAVFGEGEQNQTALSSVGKRDVFVARYSGNGALLWARSFGGPGDDGANDVVLFADGSIAIAGEFAGGMTLDPGGASEVTLQSAGGFDAFVAAFGSDGALGWARGDGGSGAESARRIVRTGSSAAIVAGTFNGTTLLGAGAPGGTALQSAGMNDVFYCRVEWE